MTAQYTYSQPDTLFNLPKNIVRQKPGPLDNSSVFASINDFEYYLSKGKKQGLVLTQQFQEYIDNKGIGYVAGRFLPYVGQLVTIADGSTVKILKITDITINESTEYYGAYEIVENLIPTDLSALKNSTTILSVNTSNQVINSSTNTQINVSQFVNDAGYITQSQAAPTKISQLSGDIGILSVRTTDNKVENAATHEQISVSQFLNDANYAVYSDIPTKVSDLTNDKDYITATDITCKVDKISIYPRNLDSYTLGEYLTLLTQDLGGDTTEPKKTK